MPRYLFCQRIFRYVRIDAGCLTLNKQRHFGILLCEIYNFSILFDS